MDWLKATHLLLQSLLEAALVIANNYTLLQFLLTFSRALMYYLVQASLFCLPQKGTTGCKSGHLPFGAVAEAVEDVQCCR